ncbi:MAG: YraN family protein [Planctomycetota bacterium]|jgi:hypothetical protein|nr:YraN family protein [Planctomycetota bacterium]MDP6938841.1 YraN family protein [Planctomycetota bacterium]
MMGWRARTWRATFKRVLRNGPIEFAPQWALRFWTLSNPELGRAGENLSARALRRAGWRILGRRMTTPHGEVDLVMAGAGQLVCVEVKAGRVRHWPVTDGRVPADWNPLGRPGRRMDRNRLCAQQRASHWLARRMEAGRLEGGRVDLVELLLDSHGSRHALVHHARCLTPLGEGPENSSPTRAQSPIHPDSTRIRYRT